MPLDLAFRLRQNLAIVLKDRGLTAAHLSRTSGIAKQVVSDWLAGAQPRKLNQLFTVAKILNVSIEKLCFAPDAQALLEKSPHPQNNSIDSGSSLPRVVDIQGRFEVHIKRIT